MKAAVAEATNLISGSGIIFVLGIRGKRLDVTRYEQQDSHVKSRCSGSQRVRRRRCVGLCLDSRGVGVAAAVACSFQRVEGALDWDQRVVRPAGAG